MLEILKTSLCQLKFNSILIYIEEKLLPAPPGEPEPGSKKSGLHIEFVFLREERDFFLYLKRMLLLPLIVNPSEEYVIYLKI